MKHSVLSATLTPLLVWTSLLLWTSTSLLQADIRPGETEDAGKKEQELVPELQQGNAGERLVNVVQEGENNLKEIQKLLDEIQKNLAARNTGKPTQEKQEEVVEKMTSLLEKLESECSKCSSSPDPSAREKKSGGEPQNKKDDAQKKKEEQAREQQKSQAELQESEKERRDGKVENDRTAEDETPDAEAGTLRARMLEASRRWGILPPKLREEVLFSTGKEAPREYLQVISRYYKRMTEFYEDSGTE